MEDVFWARTMIMVKAAELFVVTTMPAGADSNRVQRILSGYRELLEMLLPHQAQARKIREDNLKELISSPEFLKPFEVTPKEER